MIHARNLTKVVRTGGVETSILQNVNMDIEEGDFIAILGPSGSGKSTLLNMIGLIDKPSAGELFFMGHDISRLNERQRNNLRRGGIGFIFQDFGLINELTVFENIELPLRYLKFSKRERHKMVDAALEKFNIAHLRQYYPGQLTGLHQQLTGIGRSSITNPDIIVVDEPTGCLSSSCGTKVMEVIARLNEEGYTIVMATHSANEAEKGQRVVQLFDGHVVTENIKSRL